MLLIVVAEEEEIEQFIPHLNVKNIHEFDTFSFCKLMYASFKNKNFYIAISGVGKVNSALFLSYLLSNKKYNITQILNIGPAGFIGKNAHISDAFMISDSFYYDVNLTVLPHYEYGKLPNMNKEFLTSKVLNNELNSKLNLAFCQNVTADKFANKSDIEFIQKNFSKFTTIDMELSALIHTSNFFNIPISSIKIISDKLEENINSNNNYKLKSLIWKAKIATILLKLFS